MKRCLEIFGITLGSLLGGAVIILIVAMYSIFTPAHLTPIVRHIADDFITCEHEIGEVELTFFSTFPEFGLRAKGLYIINPIENAPSDTLFSASEVIAMVDVMKLLDNTLKIQQLQLTNAQANIFMNRDGDTNFNIFQTSNDSVLSNATMNFSWSFRDLIVDNLALNASKIHFVNEKDSVNATFNKATIAAHILGWDDVNLQGNIAASSVQKGNKQVVDSLQISIKLPHTGVNIDSMQFTLRDAIICMNEFNMHLNGVFSLQDDIIMDAQLTITDLNVVNLLQLVPTSYLSVLNEMDINGGALSLTAHAKGTLNDSITPLVDATLSITDAKVLHKEDNSYSIDNDFHIDAHLNDSLTNIATIEKTYASNNITNTTTSEQVSKMLSEMLSDLHSSLNVHLHAFE